jgi:hypothetical protein
MEVASLSADRSALGLGMASLSADRSALELGKASLSADRATCFPRDRPSMGSRAALGSCLAAAG